MSSTPTLLPSSATPGGSPSLSRAHFEPPHQDERHYDEDRTAPHQQQQSGKRSFYSRIGSPGEGMWRDVKGRAPFYVSDWTDAWNYRVLPATAFVFFSNVLPGIAFSLDLIETTGKYGVNEVLLSTFMAAGIFSLFGAQPLVISGVTGPITVLNKTIFTIIQGLGPSGPDYLQFIGWVYLWAAILHWIFAIWQGCKFLRYVTRFSCDTFGFYVSWVYLQYGVQILTRQFPLPALSSLLSIFLALLTLSFAHLLALVSQTPYSTRGARRFLADYGMPIAVVACSAVAYWGRLREGLGEGTTLPVGGAWSPEGGRAWVVRFWEMDAKWVGVALPFGVVLFILFAFDHNVSSVMAQSTDFPLRKPAGFHWDFFLLGITTFLAGLLGLPAPNGLIPQAPAHTKSLVVMGHPSSSSTPLIRTDIDIDPSNPTSQPRRAYDEDLNADTPPTLSEKSGAGHGGGGEGAKEVPVSVVEQRVSNLAQGAACTVMMTGPFLRLLGWVPKGVLAGLFWFMGSEALLGSGLTALLLHLIRDPSHTSPTEPLLRVRTSRIILFVLLELIGFAATFAITNTVAAIGFPVVISLMVPLRVWGVPRMGIWTEDELGILDGPVASPFTMACL